MADSESDSSSVDGGPIMMPPSPITREQLQKRIESLQQQNRVLKVELETYKLRVKCLQEENHSLRQASVIIVSSFIIIPNQGYLHKEISRPFKIGQAKAEQEEEFISNTLLKKIQALKKEKETLAHHYEQEEECLTNDLSRKLNQLRQEKCRLEQTLEQEQECLVNKLMRKIEKLEAETLTKQTNLEQLRREKVELENTLEQEQEALVNKLWKRMDKLEAEKRMLQIKLDQPVSDPASPRDINNGDAAANLSTHIKTLRSEVTRLRSKLANIQQEQKEKMQKYVNEEKHIREENLRLQRKLQLEVERREALCRQLSTTNVILEMEEERHFNEVVSSGGNVRPRGVSSPIPYNPSPSSSRPLSPGSTSRCYACGQSVGLGPQLAAAQGEAHSVSLNRSISPPVSDSFFFYDYCHGVTSRTPSRANHFLIYHLIFSERANASEFNGIYEAINAITTTKSLVVGSSRHRTRFSNGHC
ncbi:coiled-coil domain-containing protein, putative [Pediculus humanus corporis]|uniref:Coiled-coil domain-containing protein, putative n=1 Tax=Pediculus humanus subsp. corporis TaxID=121224 RepID=E0W3M3_PEDHC|nr:coiled-coil domain-containing protein, putative [Pediculus humanus corporis]EEB20229.1 coiled-coil domain-containing protein, putative [Pediculus humanus corporis]